MFFDFSFCARYHILTPWIISLKFLCLLSFSLLLSPSIFNTVQSGKQSHCECYRRRFSYRTKNLIIGEDGEVWGLKGEAGRSEVSGMPTEALVWVVKWEVTWESGNQALPPAEGPRKESWCSLWKTVSLHLVVDVELASRAGSQEESWWLGGKERISRDPQVPLHDTV